MMPVVVTVIATTIDPASIPPRSRARSGQGVSCGAYIERSKVFADIITAANPDWIRYAISETLIGRMPRTMAYVVPSCTGGHGINLGRGALRRGMAFGGAVDTSATTREEFVMQRVTVEEEEVLLDDFDNLLWPMWCVKGATA